jgi:hypothetical protein
MSATPEEHMAECVCCGEVVAWVNLDGVCMAYCNLHSLAQSAEHKRVGDFWKIGLTQTVCGTCGSSDLNHSHTEPFPHSAREHLDTIRASSENGGTE